MKSKICRESVLLSHLSKPAFVYTFRIVFSAIEINPGPAEPGYILSLQAV